MRTQPGTLAKERKLPPLNILSITCAVFVLAISASSGLAQSVAPPRLRDSAGVQIVEHGSLRSLPSVAIITAAPALDIGGAKTDPQAEFDPRNPFLSAVLLSDRRIVGTDYASFKILDPAGKFIRVVSRAGTGPGEFRQLRGVCVAPGDTIIALGYGNRRASVFTSTGQHVRDLTLTGYVPESPCFADGTFLIATDSRPNPRSKLAPALAAAMDEIHTLKRVDQHGNIVGTVGDFRSETYVGGLQTVANSVVSNSMVYSGDGRDPEVRVHSKDGRLIRLIKWDEQPVPITREMIQRMAEQSIPMNVTPEQRAQRLERMMAQPHLPTMPVYSLIMADYEGRVWVQDPFEAKQPRGWTLFASNGAVIGRTMIPMLGGNAGRTPEIAGFLPGRILLRWDDSDGNAHLSFHDLRATGERFIP